MDEAGAASSAQLLSPIGMQLVLTPIHLLALNIYNEPKAAPAERAQQVGRLVPAYPYPYPYPYPSPYP